MPQALPSPWWAQPSRRSLDEMQGAGLPGSHYQDRLRSQTSEREKAHTRPQLHLTSAITTWEGASQTAKLRVSQGPRRETRICVRQGGLRREERDAEETQKAAPILAGARPATSSQSLRANSLALEALLSATRQHCFLWGFFARIRNLGTQRGPWRSSTQYPPVFSGRLQTGKLRHRAGR